MVRRRWIPVVVAAVLALGACGSDSSDKAEGPAASSGNPAPASPGADASTAEPGSAAAAPTGAGSSAPPAAAVPEKLRFTATTLDGARFEGAQLAGKPVVFWFWAPWCPKCRSEAPGVAEVSAAFQGKVSFVGVAGLDKESAMEKFVADTKTGSIPHLSDEKGEVWRKLGITQQSTFVFMASDGSTSKASGPLGKDELERKVAELAAKG
ncbi:redoxin domain-containing protein [Yinghuangia sp. YIM S09857]|uniref:redoxin domain-containing protein n=1 Tax=Yinghuangia sp. YIM S09857 TaxID=3436929 RepID=UPI003F52DE5A